MIDKNFRVLLAKMGDILDFNFGIIDSSGSVFSKKPCLPIENSPFSVFKLANSGNSQFEGFSLSPSSPNGNADFVVFVEGLNENAQKCAAMLNVSLSEVKKICADKTDKLSFVKNIILNNVFPGDVHPKSTELRIPFSTERVVCVIAAMSGSESPMFSILSHLLPDKNKDFLISLDDKTFVLVSEDSADDILVTAKSIVDTLASEVMVRARVGIGAPVLTLTDIAKSYKEACVALEVGKIFDTGKDIIQYENLGLGRLIYQLPTTLCELFLSEVFKKESLSRLDRETMTTIQKFFENNLNVSETARHLYVHRNTLVYRLDKIQHLTGLDLRNFEHAVVFKVALMVHKYLSSNPLKF